MIYQKEFLNFHALFVYLLVWDSFNCKYKCIIYLLTCYDKCIKGINAVMSSATKKIDAVGKVTPDLSEVYNDLLKSEQNSSSPMPNLPPPICTDTSTSKNASNSTTESGYESDVCLDDCDKESRRPAVSTKPFQESISNKCSICTNGRV